MDLVNWMNGLYLMNWVIWMDWLNLGEQFEFDELGALHEVGEFDE